MAKNGYQSYDEWVAGGRKLYADTATKTSTFVINDDGGKAPPRFGYGKDAAADGFPFAVQLDNDQQEKDFKTTFNNWKASRPAEQRHVYVSDPVGKPPPDCGTPSTPICPPPPSLVKGVADLRDLMIGFGRSPEEQAAAEARIYAFLRSVLEQTVKALEHAPSSQIEQHLATIVKLVGNPRVTAL
jgi:hypothetical protein